MTTLFQPTPATNVTTANCGDVLAGDIAVVR